MKQEVYLKDTDLAKIYGVSRQTVWRWNEVDPSFPSPVKLSAGATRWRKTDIDAWESNKSNIEFEPKIVKQKTHIEKTPTVINDLVGSHFHSVNEKNEINWQGYVLSHVYDGYYLVQLYEWMFGSANVRRVVSIVEMKSWLFYESAEQMKDSYENGIAFNMKAKV